MELSSEDIIRLYGRYLFVIPKEEIQADALVPDNEEVISPEKIEEIVQSKAELPIAEEPQAKETQPIETLPAPEATVQSELTSGAPVVWKMRANARIAMVMPEADFKNRAMTIILKDCVERAGMETQFIGFGVLKSDESAFDFSKQPVPFSLVFSPGVSEKQMIQLEGGQEIYPMPGLIDIIMQQEKQAELILLLQQLNERL